MPAVIKGSLVENFDIALGMQDDLDRTVTREVASHLVRYAKEFCPVADDDERKLAYEIMTHSKGQVAKITYRKAGTLRDSIVRVRLTKTARGYRSGAKTDDPIAPYVEWNTRAHIIRPKAHAGSGPGMRRNKQGQFVRAAHALRWIDFGVGGNVIAMVRFAREVHHPGTTGAHFMARAADRVEKEIPALSEREIGNWLRKSGLA